MVIKMTNNELLISILSTMEYHFNDTYTDYNTAHKCQVTLEEITFTIYESDKRVYDELVERFERLTMFEVTRQKFIDFVEDH